MKQEKRPVKIGSGTLRPMTQAQAQLYGLRTMPSDLKTAGFECIIFVSDPEINGSIFYRINYCKG